MFFMALVITSNERQIEKLEMNNKELTQINIENDYDINALYDKVEFIKTVIDINNQEIEILVKQQNENAQNIAEFGSLLKVIDEAVQILSEVVNIEYGDYKDK